MLRFTHFLAIAALQFSATLSVKAAYHFTTLASGTQQLVLSSGSMHTSTVNFATNTVNRSATGFGDQSLNAANVIEGMWMQYSFTVPSGKASNFDMQHTMGGMWSGFGGPMTGEWQRGPTSSTWNRNTRVQHDFVDRPGTAATLRGTDATVPIVGSTLSMPADGDVFQVLMVLNAITNSLEYTYTNLTKNEVFTYTLTNAHSGIPNTNLSFNNWILRSDVGPITSVNYSLGTLHVIPEPSIPMLLAGGFTIVACMRRRAI